MDPVMVFLTVLLITIGIGTVILEYLYLRRLKK